jgi:hypothetical protein
MNQMRLKPEEIKYDYCWHCLCNTELCPDCGGNACACGCPMQSQNIEHDNLPCTKSGFWEVIDEARALGYIPKEPQPEAINDWIQFMLDKWPNLPKEDREARKIFGDSILEESDYYWVKKGADFHGMQIPTLEEIGEEIGEAPDYDCNTGLGFQQETLDIVIVDPTGWPNGTYETERIPWYEFCIRRENSITDYTEFNKKYPYNRKNR